MEKIIKTTHRHFKAAVLLPGANTRNTTVIVDEINRKIFIDVEAGADLPKFVTAAADLDAAVEITLPEQFDLAINVTIQSGIVYIKAKAGKQMKEVKIG